MLIFFGVWFAAETAIGNLQRLNIASGFGFLDYEAGFGVSQSLIAYDEQSSYGRAFVVGLLNTLMCAAIGTVLATFLGFGLGVARLSPNWLIAKLATVYVETLRNIPLLLQLFFWYFAVLRAVPRPRDSLVFLDTIYLNNRGIFFPKPVLESGGGLLGAAFVVAALAVGLMIWWARRRRQETGRSFPMASAAAGLLVGLPGLVFLVMGAPVHFDAPALDGFNFQGGLSLLPEFIALTLALSTYTAAFIGEIVRAGIQSVDRGQREAAAALGLKPGLALRLIVIPQAMRLIIPPLTSQYLNLTKNSSLAVAIAYPDLVSVFAGTVLNQTGQAIEVIALTMAVYLTLSLATSGLMNLYNQRMALTER